MRSKTVAIAVSVLLLVMMLAVACDPGGEEEVKASVLTIAWGEETTSLNPFFAKTESDYQYLGFIYEPLCMPLKDGTIGPWIANSWNFDEDEVAWTFLLDEKALWSDGEPVTARDVKFTFDTTYANDYLLGISTKPMVKEIVVEDEKTVVFKLHMPSPGFLYLAGSTWIVPEHIFAEVDNLDEYQNPEPIGSGPYLFKELKRGSHIHLLRNEKYWNGNPKIEEILIRDFGGPENAVMPLLKGDVDIVPELSGHETLISKLLKDENVTVAIDDWPNIWYVAPNYRKYPLDQVDVRRAIDLAIDKDKLIDNCLLGYAELPLMGYFPPSNTKWANADAVWKGLNVDREERLEKANKLLDDLGFKMGGDGVRVTDKGSRMEFSIMCIAQYPSYVRACEAIKLSLEDIGISLNVEVKDAGTLFGGIVFSSEGSEKWDLLLHGSVVDPDPDDMVSEWAPEGEDAYFNANAFGWRDETIQGILRDSVREADDEKRVQMIKEAQQMFADELVVITLGHRNHAGAYREDKFTGWNPVDIQYGLMIHPLTSLQNIISLSPR